MLHITLNDVCGDFEYGTTVLDVLKALKPASVDTAIGCLCGGVSLELTHVLDHDCVLSPITVQDEEGRRMYERSLRFVMLLAARRVFPDVTVRMEHSLGNGVYVTFLNRAVSDNDLALLSDEMHKIVSQNLPFTHEHWTKQKAIEYFSAEGEIDKTRLLAYRPYDFFNVYRCGDMAEYFYGTMLPSTGYVNVFSLEPHAPGFVLMMPSYADPSIPGKCPAMPKHFQAFAQSNEWCRILGCTNAADLNDLIVKKKLRDFIRVNEALQDKSISEIADGIKSRGARAIFIAGPSSSGKTTFANRLCIHLRVLGLCPILISLDDFYRDRVELPLEADGKPDLEALSALDVPLIHKVIDCLLKGEETELPHFSFVTGKREEHGEKITLSSDQPIVIEGIHALNPALHGGFDPRLICRIFISELTCLNLDNHNRIRTTDARLLRRIVRDFQFRGTQPDATMSMWDSVHAGEKKWIFPFQEQADYVFNSALHYELSVLKPIAYDMLKAITPDNPNYLLSRRLLKILHYLLPAPKEVLEEIPPLSILREFIGGCTLYE